MSIYEVEFKPCGRSHQPWMAYRVKAEDRSRAVEIARSYQRQQAPGYVLESVTECQTAQGEAA